MTFVPQICTIFTDSRIIYIRVYGYIHRYYFNVHIEEGQFTSGHEFHARLLNYDEQREKVRLTER